MTKPGGKGGVQEAGNSNQDNMTGRKNSKRDFQKKRLTRGEKETPAVQTGYWWLQSYSGKRIKGRNSEKPFRRNLPLILISYLIVLGRRSGWNVSKFLVLLAGRYQRTTGDVDSIERNPSICKLGLETVGEKAEKSCTVPEAKPRGRTWLSRCLANLTLEELAQKDCHRRLGKDGPVKILNCP